ncbi:PREDICTED: tRNA-splicing endonuclease subunit Sen2 [Habropoda laboriosa]|uniref:tRNA-splicing endonuclease subunit Sen2 n=1 Tax=Habropoda laboriosa TaxID=597456 RepID=UPI00083D98F0|nr:PREDICTED: tRNA-splicing endonuclease subunit Sen2 [Habropoda laboriosa]
MQNMKDMFQKKRHVKLKEELPFPIVLCDKNEWTTYTAHLTDLGSCIIDQNEIIAIHSMGFFGKSSLSRGFPSFSKARYGAPPVVKNRQWIRRQEWLKQFNELSMEPNSKHTNLEENKHKLSHSVKLDENDVKFLSGSRKESAPDIIEIEETNSVSLEKKYKKNQETDEEVKIDYGSLDTKKGDMLVIVDKNINKQCNNADNNEKQCTGNEGKELYCFTDFSFKRENVCFVSGSTEVQSELLILPDSDSETENYLKDIKPKIEYESFPAQETLYLTFEETFFLLYGIGCLNLIDFDGNLLDVDHAWHSFCKIDQNFIPKYVTYHYFRSKGWVVKPGLKYGGDFLLYKQGPPFYHASYIVIIDTLDGDSLIRNQNKCMHKLTWNNLLGLERLSETAAKEILFAQVLWPSSALQTSNLLNVDILSEFSVKELLWRRWNPKYNRDVEEDNDDSC